MGTAGEMRTLSSLELMLLNLRKAEEEPPEDSPPPPLPARPVVKLRPPRPRKKQPFMSGKSQFRQEHQVKKEGKDAFLDSIPQMESSDMGDRLIDFNEDVEEKERKNLLKGVMVIQRSYRGHQAYNYYHELKRGAITLQSCIRGWFARRAFTKQVANQEANKTEFIKAHINTSLHTLLSHGKLNPLG
ncbi:unnamed protein product [Cuscuta campestris]|uniref:Myosin motor domain-containing protein n=1 Tax=Cuscuta campestris TaxID=132261 RepID=A0A484LZG2_9ASTE|nr:unnamed protein product [Cuscuta campestris]